jgi:hypothetical protein
MSDFDPDQFFMPILKDFYAVPAAWPCLRRNVAQKDLRRFAAWAEKNRPRAFTRAGGLCSFAGLIARV